MEVPLDRLVNRDPKFVEYIVVHHSVASPDTDIETLSKEEIESQGFICIGYNAYVKREGKVWVIQQGRPLNKLPAAQYGLNLEGYAICIGGNYQTDVPGVPTDKVDPSALDAVLRQILLAKPKLPNLKYLIGHRNVADIMVKRGFNAAAYSTECPGNTMLPFLDNLRKNSGLTLPPEMR